MLPAAQCQQQGFRAFGAAAHDDHHDEPTYTEIPTVFDRLVNITVVDLNGKRHAIKGLTGTTLSQALIEAGFPKTYFFPNMGFYTQHIVDAHVFIPKDQWKHIPNYKDDSEEADAIKRTFRDIIQDFAKDTSYLASYVTLKPEMNNMTVGIGPVKPWILHSNWAFGGVHDTTETQFSKPTVDIMG